MKLPNGDRAVVDLDKLADYCLNPEHGRGRHKARVFAAVLGLRKDDAGFLGQALREAARECEVAPTLEDDYGQRCMLDFDMAGPAGEGRVRSVWIVRRNENFPRFVTCYVL
jgi:hypothetical protein